MGGCRGSLFNIPGKSEQCSVRASIGWGTSRSSSSSSSSRRRVAGYGMDGNRGAVVFLIKKQSSCGISY